MQKREGKKKCSCLWTLTPCEITFEYSLRSGTVLLSLLKPYLKVFQTVVYLGLTDLRYHVNEKLIHFGMDFLRDFLFSSLILLTSSPSIYHFQCSVYFSITQPVSVLQLQFNQKSCRGSELYYLKLGRLPICYIWYHICLLGLSFPLKTNFQGFYNNWRISFIYLFTLQKLSALWYLPTVQVFTNGHIFHKTYDQNHKSWQHWHLPTKITGWTITKTVYEIIRYTE